MFAIYDVNGRRFRDTLEALYRVKKPYDATVALTNKGEEMEAEQLKQRFRPMSNQAINSYKQAINTTIREPVYHAYQVMSSPVITLNPGVTLSSAAAQFDQHRVRQMPVVDVHRRLVGMMTKHQLERAILNESLRHRGTKTIESVMTTEVISADPIADIRRVVRLLLDLHLNAVPIVDERDEVVGIVTRKDILRTVINEPSLHLFV